MAQDLQQTFKEKLANAMLNRAATLWFLIAVLGQLMFAVYIVAFYGRGVIAGDLKLWNQVLAAGYVPGNTMGNAALAIHLLLAAAITIGGPVQLIPQVRARAPRFHHEPDGTLFDLGQRGSGWWQCAAYRNQLECPCDSFMWCHGFALCDGS